MVDPGGRELTKAISKFTHSSRAKSVWQLLNSLIPFFAFWYLATWALDYSYWLWIPSVVFMAGFFIRIFIIFHDCGHQSFFKSKKANRFWGVLTGVLTLTPFHRWTAEHARHHATSGNLDKRGSGDVWTMTLGEYYQASKWVRLKYRLYRNPFVMFCLGPLSLILISNRTTERSASRSEKLSVLFNNVVIGSLIIGVIFVIGWRAIVLVHLPAVVLAHFAGVWLFYIQHQFEDVYWERSERWDYVTAALQGGSYYRLPAVLRWFTGNIGFHHVHHLNSRIPNYNLPACHNSVEQMQSAPCIGFFSGFKAISLRLWDEQSGRMVSFRAAKKIRQMALAPALSTD